MTVLSISVETHNEAKRVFDNELANLTKDDNESIISK